jgi:7,8-dihydropterin-6-yl-methyl-4-(beta-D-ribofuranosyl)aminobenzene 5'-phosphate synthase
MHMRTRQRAVIVVAIAVLSLGVLLAAGGQAPTRAGGPTLTVLFDNTAFQAGCTAGWGFSALIEGVGRTILFDAGADEAVFRKNVEALKVDLQGVDFVFISHDHDDHTGGLRVMLQKKAGLTVYVPASAQQAFQAEVRKNGGRPAEVTEPQPLAPGVVSTGDVGTTIHEQALLLDTPRGLVVITGCAHPGIVKILEKAQAVGKKNVWMVLGGFHLYETAPADVEKIVARFKELGVQRVGATHCTGDPAIATFRRAYGANFVEMGVGRKIDLGSR